jgi:Bacterial SH3 domain/GW (Gly-Tryp) dipeptide domain
MMDFRNHFVVGLLSLGAVMASALPSIARPATIDIEANVRSAPSLGADRIDGVPVGTPVEVLRIVDDTHRYKSFWYYIRSTGNLQTEGWVDGGLVRFGSSIETYGVLLGSMKEVINIRSQPSLVSEIVHTGVGSDLVTVGESQLGDGGYRWYYVTYPNQAAGWVRSDLIDIWPQGCIITCPAN